MIKKQRTSSKRIGTFTRHTVSRSRCRWDVVAKVELLQFGAGAWFWHAVGFNGEILCHSESYSSKTKAQQTAAKVAKQLGVKLT